ncbi:hypothetical protein DRO26_02995 [Candidatus Bathyarchaeota archaeon]|nr:MAG: hypothetical protein DRO26_02995 [Candidatus Bathyarchaeota archaeon]
MLCIIFKILLLKPQIKIFEVNNQEFKCCYRKHKYAFNPSFVGVQPNFNLKVGCKVFNFLSVWIAILIALTPAFILFLYLAGTETLTWASFGMGALGWLFALLLRVVPLQIPVTYGMVLATSLAYFGYSSILAGIFEEGIRYLLMKKIGFIRLTLKHILSFGLGWGFGEAVVVYVVNIISAVYFLGYKLTFMDMLPGAVERNLAIMFHTALTLLVLKALASKKFLWVAMTIHATVDFVSLTVFRLLGFPVWYVEGIIFVMTLATVIYAYMLSRRMVDIKSTFFFKF